MAFCKQCGADLNGAKFCPNCGSPVEDNGATPMNQRQRSMAEMERMMQYFGQKKQQYDEFEKVTKEVADRSAESFVGGIILAVICAAIGYFSKKYFWFVGVPLFLLMYFVKTNKNKKALAIAVDRRNALGEELQAHFDAYGYAPVGFEYTRPQTLAAIYDIIRKGRASTAEDAINLYLNDQHQEKMLQLQKETAAAAKESAAAAKEAAKNSGKTATYTAIDFWFR